MMNNNLVEQNNTYETNNIEFKKWHIYWADIPKTVGSVQYGKRPILCLGNIKGLNSCGNINYIILTSKLDKRRLIVHHQLSKNKYSFLKCDSTVACETISTISKECILSEMGELDDEKDKDAIKKCLLIQLGLLD